MDFRRISVPRWVYSSLELPAKITYRCLSVEIRSKRENFSTHKQNQCTNSSSLYSPIRLDFDNTKKTKLKVENGRERQKEGQKKREWEKTSHLCFVEWEQCRKLLHWIMFGASERPCAFRTDALRRARRIRQSIQKINSMKAKFSWCTRQNCELDDSRKTFADRALESVSERNIQPNERNSDGAFPSEIINFIIRDN